MNRNIERYFVTNPPAYTVQLVLRILGGIFFVFNGLLTIVAFLEVTGISRDTDNPATIGIFISVLVFTLISIYVYKLGRDMKKRMQRYKRYIQEFIDDNKLPISYFSKLFGISNKEVIADLNFYIKKNYFKEGFISADGEYAFSTKRAYLEYKISEEENHLKSKQATNGTEKLYEEEKNIYIPFFNEKAQSIEGEMSEKIGKILELTTLIFKNIQQDNDDSPTVRKFITYYLPSTKKLIDRYVNLPNVDLENTKKMKTEIISSMDVLITAYENLLDTLLTDNALDLSAEVEVLKSMLKQEGLYDKDFE